jgi:myo-inositol-1(or 4)-monophosphatase
VRGPSTSPTVPGPDSLDPAIDNLSGQLLELAVTFARRAGRTAVEMRSEAVASATTKSSPTDPVTAADQEAEAVVVEGILRHRPDDSIVGEEGAQRRGTSPVVWYIDPIDGTTNYLYDIPAYAVSIAAAVDGVLVAGAVFNPVLDELFTARAGHGAHLNGRPVQVRPPVPLSSALVATGFGYQAERRRLQAVTLTQLLPAIRDIRRFGSAALDLCALATGRVDAYYEIGLNVWDYAAGWLLVHEAGGRCRDLAGDDPSPRFFMAAGPDLIEPLAGAIREAVASVEGKSWSTTQNL